MGWTSIQNGELLSLAIQSGFEGFITVDRNLSFQQHLPKFEIAVLVLHAPSNRLSDLKRLIPKLLSAIDTAAPGDLVVIAELS
jgi:hypothetical protein